MQSPYTRQLKYTASTDQMNALLFIFDQIGIRQWLSENPFSGLEFRDKVVLNQNEVNGWYSYKDRNAQIALARDETSFGAVLDWGQIQSVSTVSSSSIEAIRKTMVHELGHHVHGHLLANFPELFGITMRTIRSDAISNYAKSPKRPEEYFAESFAAWVFHRTDFIVFDQQGYATMDKVLNTLGIEVREYEFSY
jgi:hypothetical protein